MRKSVLLASLPILFTLSCGQGPEPLDASRKDALKLEVEKTLVSLTEAMNSHDAEEVLGYFRESEEFLYLGCTDFMLGWQGFSPRVVSYYAQNPEVVFHQEVVRTQILSPTVAVVALKGGSTKSEALFWTEVLVKEDGAWVIAHEHESWPGCPPPSTPHPFTTADEMTGMGVLDTIGP